eukprot:SAG22_NODE_2290_length_2752_cov_2.249152_4_plen_180_part_00
MFSPPSLDLSELFWRQTVLLTINQVPALQLVDQQVGTGHDGRCLPEHPLGLLGFLPGLFGSSPDASELHERSRVVRGKNKNKTAALCRAGDCSLAAPNSRTQQRSCMQRLSPAQRPRFSSAGSRRNGEASDPDAADRLAGAICVNDKAAPAYPSRAAPELGRRSWNQSHFGASRQAGQS